MDHDDCWGEDMGADGNDYAEELDRERRSHMVDEDGNPLYECEEDDDA